MIAWTVYCLPSNSPSFRSATSNPPMQPSSSLSGSTMASEAMVCTITFTAAGNSMESKSALSDGEQGVASLPRMPPAMVMASLISEVILDGDSAVVNTIENTSATSTRSLYANYWKLFVNWCDASGTLPTHCLLPWVQRFLQQFLDEGKSPLYCESVGGCYFCQA